MFMKIIPLLGIGVALVAGAYFTLDTKAAPAPVNEIPVYHDWECKYIVRDGYHQDTLVHYIDEYIINVDGSISFVDNEGLICNIPYPYFQVIKNEKQAG